MTIRMLQWHNGLDYGTVHDLLPAAEDNLVSNGLAARHSRDPGGLLPIARDILQLGQPQLQPIPQRTTPHKITGATRYLDPTWGGPFNGTFTQPYNSPTQATLAAGDGLLFKAGTTTTIAAAIVPAADGTAGAPIIYGVYDPASTATDKRIYHRQGMATINCNGGNFGAIAITDRQYVCIDGLAFTNNASAAPLVLVNGDSLGWQVLNCTATGGASIANFAHFQVGGSGAGVIEGCRSINSPKAGIVLQIAADDTASKAHFNQVSGAVDRSLMVYDGYFGYKFGGTVACNVITDAGAGSEDGIWCIVAGGAPKIFRNTIRRCKIGAGWVSSIAFSATAADFSGALIENNDISNCEFNISLGLCFGTWLIQYNRLLDAGSYTGAAPVTAGPVGAYGRCIELFGETPAIGCRDGTIRFNYCAGAYNWQQTQTPGSEGVGIGLDNNTANVQVYGNYCIGNEGSGIQVNSGFGNAVYGNVCVDNFRFREGRLTVPREQDCAQIAYVLTPGLLIYNNTCISTGGPHQKYGISEAYAGTPSPLGQVFNNLIIGASVAGLLITDTANTATELNNVVSGSPKLVVNEALASRTPGAGTRAAVEGDIGATEYPHRPLLNSPCDGTGAAAPAVAVSFDGLQLCSRTPIGALHAAY